MSDENYPHPASRLGQSLRVEYACAIASLVMADGRLHAAERSRMIRLCEALDIADVGRAVVDASIRKPNFARIEESLRRFSLDETVRFSLLADAMVIAFADGQLDPSERSELAAFAAVLGFTADQVLEIARHVERTLESEPEPGAAPLSEALAPGLEGLPVDPASSRAAIRWLHERLGAA